MASVTAESDEACAGREVVVADGIKHGDRRLLVHHRPDDRKLNGPGWPRPRHALRGRARGRRQRPWLPTSGMSPVQRREAEPQALADVGAVYELTPVVCSPADVLASKRGEDSPPAPKAKWVTASMVEDAAVVIVKVFDKAERRDPNHSRRWVALVDANNHQIDRIEKEATARGADVTIVVEFIHVLEYLWGAVWCSSPEGDTALRLGCMIEHWPCWRAMLGKWPLASDDSGQQRWD